MVILSGIFRSPGPCAETPPRRGGSMDRQAAIANPAWPFLTRLWHRMTARQGVPRPLFAVDGAVRAEADGEERVPPHAAVRIAALEADLLAARHQLSFLEQLVDELPTPIFAKNADARYCLVNKAYEEFFGVQREHLLGLTVMDLEYLGEEDRKRYQNVDIPAVRKGLVRRYETEYDTPTGRRHAMYWTKGFGNLASKAWAQIGMIVDISEMAALRARLADKIEELKRIQRELRHQSRSDALTGLANRRPFAEYLGLSMDLARRKKIPTCMLLADIDHFKSINDTYGHDVGDMVLRALAGMLRSACRARDLAARIGGEEFAVLLTATQLEDAVLVAERIRLNIGETPLLPDGGRVTVSIGVAMYRPNESAHAFMKRADAAMYRAKTSGRNRVCCR